MTRLRLLSFLLLLLSTTSSARAALVATTLTLDAATATENRIGLNFPVLGAATTTDISGTIEATIDIDQMTGVITSIDLTGGSIAFTDWTLDTPIGTFTGTGTTGTTNTPTPPGLVVGSMFNAADHQVLLTGGVVNPGNNNVAGTEVNGSGMGTLVANLNGSVFDVVLTLPVNETNTELGTTLVITGNVVARGQIAVVPEPSSSLALCGLLVCGIALRRKHRRAD